MTSVTITDAPLSIADVLAVVNGAPVDLAPDAAPQSLLEP